MVDASWGRFEGNTFQSLVGGPPKTPMVVVVVNWYLATTLEEVAIFPDVSFYCRLRRSVGNKMDKEKRAMGLQPLNSILAIWDQANIIANYFRFRPISNGFYSLCLYPTSQAYSLGKDFMKLTASYLTRRRQSKVSWSFISVSVGLSHGPLCNINFKFNCCVTLYDIMAL